MPSVDFDKLTRDIREAKAEAELVSVPDGGSCNSDRCALAVPKGTRAASVKNAAFAAGIRCYATDSRMRGRLFHLDIGGGQGAQRTARAEAMTRAMQARGWDAQMWWEVD